MLFYFWTPNWCYFNPTNFSCVCIIWTWSLWLFGSSITLIAAQLLCIWCEGNLGHIVIKMSFIFAGLESDLDLVTIVVTSLDEFGENIVQQSMHERIHEVGATGAICPFTSEASKYIGGIATPTRWSGPLTLYDTACSPSPFSRAGSSHSSRPWLDLPVNSCPWTFCDLEHYCRSFCLFRI